MVPLEDHLLPRLMVDCDSDLLEDHRMVGYEWDFSEDHQMAGYAWDFLEDRPTTGCDLVCSADFAMDRLEEVPLPDRVEDRPSMGCQEGLAVMTLANRLLVDHEQVVLAHHHPHLRILHRNADTLCHSP